MKKKFIDESLSLRKRTSGYTSARLSAEHVPRVVKLIGQNPGLTADEIFALRPFNFGRSTLTTILVAAKKKGLVRFTKESRTSPAKYYIVEEECQTNPITEEVNSSDT